MLSDYMQNGKVTSKGYQQAHDDFRDKKIDEVEYQNVKESFLGKSANLTRQTGGNFQNTTPKIDVGYLVLGLFVPLIALIIAIVQRKKSSLALKSAAIGIAINIVLGMLLLFYIFAGLMSVLSNIPG